MTLIRGTLSELTWSLSKYHPGSYKLPGAFKLNLGENNQKRSHVNEK